MDELKACAFVISLMGLGVAGLIWATAHFAQMSRVLGLFGYWGFAVPSTRAGMSAAMAGVVLLGTASLPPRLAFYPEEWRSAFLVLCLFCIAFGFVHDLACFLGRPAK